jgi:hypothetical protein
MDNAAEDTSDQAKCRPKRAVFPPVVSFHYISVLGQLCDLRVGMLGETLERGRASSDHTKTGRNFRRTGLIAHDKQHHFRFVSCWTCM